MQVNVFASWLTPKATVGPSKVAGHGLIATERIVQGELIAIWGGCLMSYNDLQHLPEEVRKCHVQIWHDLFVGPVDSNHIEAVDYMNHSCEPNCGVKGQIVVVARRDVQQGEELTFDYSTTDTVGLDMECSCRTPSCRGRVTSNDWKNPEFRQRHSGYLSTYIEETARAFENRVLPANNNLRNVPA